MSRLTDVLVPILLSGLAVAAWLLVLLLVKAVW